MTLENFTQNEPATKILCIGASTYNPGTPGAVTQALHETDLLIDWTIIWVVHDYYKLWEEKDSMINKIRNDSNKINERLVFVNEITNYPIYKGYLYILPDSSRCDWTSKHILTRIINDQNILTIQAFIHTDRNLEEFTYTGTGQLLYLPYIDQIMIQLAYNHTDKLAGLILAGLYADGAKGMLAINKQGGKTAVQNPDECYHPYRKDTTASMPREAIAEAKKQGLDHDIITLKIQEKENTNDIRSLATWLESLKNIE